MSPARSSRRARRPRDLADWLAFAEAWVSLLAIDLCLRFLPFRWAERLGGPEVRQTGGSPPDRAGEAARCAWAAAAASRHHLWPMRCLARSLGLRRLLARRGIAGVLRIGVARQDGRLLAHAWIEWEGRPLGEAEESIARFEPMELAEVRRSGAFQE